MATSSIRIKLAQPMDFDQLYGMVMADPAFAQAPPAVTGKNKRRQLTFNGFGKYNNAVSVNGNKIFVMAVPKPEHAAAENAKNFFVGGLIGAAISAADGDLKNNEGYLLGLADQVRRITGGQ